MTSKANKASTVKIASSSSSSIDKSLFGSGYLTEDEKSNIFIFTSNKMQFSQEVGIGGAVPVRAYNGPWPLFGNLKDSWEAHHIEQMDGVEAAGSSEILTSSLNRTPRMMCKSTGKCRACSKKEKSRPYCQPYGNAAPIECRPVTMLEAEEELPPTHLKPANDEKGKGKTTRRNTSNEDIEWQLWKRQETVISSTVYKGFQTCGRDPIKETWDYSEFIVLNLLLALGSLYVLVKRQRLLAGQHQAMLARRIGRI